jgi:hypothetical protein
MTIVQIILNGIFNVINKFVAAFALLYVYQQIFGDLTKQKPLR